MKPIQLVTGLVLLISVVLLGVILFDFTGSQPNIRGVEVEVETGTVAFKSTDGSVDEKIEKGETLTVGTDQSTQLKTPTATPGGEPQPVATPLPSIANNSIVVINAINTENIPIGSATGTVIVNETNKTFQLDKDGKAAIPDLQPGTALITIFHPSILANNLFNGEIVSGTNEIAFHVATRARLRGIVKGINNQPLPNIQTVLLPAKPEQTIPQSDLQPRQSNEDGAFLYEPVVSGEYVLSASAEGYLPYEKTVLAKDDETQLNVTLRSKSQVEVTVNDEKDNPIFFAKTMLRSTGSQGIVLMKETSESTGKAVFDNVPAGEYEISAEHIWHTDAGEGKKSIQVQLSEQSVKLTLANREYTISGRVLNKNTGEPVMEAEVVAFAENEMNRDAFIDAVYDPFEMKYNVEPVARTVSNADGSYRLTKLSGGTYMVGVSPRRDYVFQPFSSKKGFDDINPIVRLQNELDVNGVDLQLLPAWAVSGKVLLEDGTPLDRAEIKVTAEYGGIKHYAYVTQIGFRENRSTSVTVSQPDGSYRFEGNSYVFTDDFKLYVNASHRKYRSAMKDMGLVITPKPGEELTNVDLVYESKAIVRGRITDEQDIGIDDAIVQIGNRTKGWSNFYANTDGFYEAYLEPGDYPNVWVSKEGYITLDHDTGLELEAGEEIDHFDFQLKKGDEWFAGRVVNEEGEPVSSLRVHLTSNQEPSFGGGDGFTDREGKFKIVPWRPVPQEISEFTIHAYATEIYDEASVTVYERWAKNVELTMRKYDKGYGSIAGVVMNQQRKPLQEFEVRLLPTNVRSWENRLQYHYDWKQASHPDGAFLLQNIPVVDGPFVVMARTKNTAQAFSEVITLQKDEAKQNVSVIVHEPSFSIHGTVVDDSGTALEGVRVAFRATVDNYLKPFAGVSGGWNELVRSYPSPFTDKTGAFQLEGLPVSGGQLWIMRFDEPNVGEMLMPLPEAQPDEKRDLGSINFVPNVNVSKE